MEFIKWLSVLLLFACGSKLNPVVKEAENVSFKTETGSSQFFPELKTPFMTNTTMKSENELSLKLKPIVYLYTSEGCLSCMEEHQKIQNAIEEGILNTDDFNIFSILINFNFDNQDDFDYAKTIYESLGMSWGLGADFERTSFDRFCKESVTPCTVIFPSLDYNPSFQSHDLLSIEKIKEEINKASLK